MEDTVELVWRKASYSGNGGNSCVEVAFDWRKASYSANGGNSCVEVARNVPGTVAVRDSKDPQGPRLGFGPADWRRFTDALKER